MPSPKLPIDLGKRLPDHFAARHEVQQPTVVVVSAGKDFDWLSPMISLIVAGGTVLAVHRLTQSREKDKGVNDLNWKIIDSLDEVRELFKDELAKRPLKGAKLVLDALTKLQHIGGLAERMRIYSRYRPLKRPWTVYEISLKREMRELRDTLTSDAVVGVTARTAPAVSEEAERAIFKFLSALNSSVNRWVGGLDPC